MPPETTEQVRARILELLKETPNVAEVKRRLEKENIIVSVGPIRRVADQHKDIIHLSKGGRPRGLKMPGVGGGRPKGTTTSPFREPALRMHRRGMKSKEIAEILGISRQRVEKFISDDNAEK
jgi:hypothetical protein